MKYRQILEPPSILIVSGFLNPFSVYICHKIGVAFFSVPSHRDSRHTHVRRMRRSLNKKASRSTGIVIFS